MLSPSPLRLAVLIAVLGLLLSTSAFARPATHTVRKGDTLTSIAKRHGVKVKELRRWNGLGRKVNIQPGDKLHLRKNSATRGHRVRKGETLAGIAKREGLAVDDILGVNPGLSAGRLRAGDVIELPGAPANAPKPKPTRRATKTKPCPGEVVKLSKHPYYRLRSKANSWATRQTAKALRRGFDHVRERHRLAPAVHVHDASSKSGGQLGDHRSHREHRDIDIAFYQRRCPRTGCRVQVVTPKKLDVRRQWTLISYWLRQDDLEAVFIDHKLQKVLYEHAKKRGVSKRKLNEWFQYPYPPGTKRGVIRHWEGHRNHVHARFKKARCPGGCCK